MPTLFFIRQKVARDGVPGLHQQTDMRRTTDTVNTVQHVPSLKKEILSRTSGINSDRILQKLKLLCFETDSL